MSSEDFRHDDCFVFVAMSHGEEGVLYCADGTVCIDEVALRFKGDMCPSLVGKPKLFFIQVCLGELYFMKVSGVNSLKVVDPICRYP